MFQLKSQKLFGYGYDYNLQFVSFSVCSVSVVPTQQLQPCMFRISLYGLGSICSQAMDPEKLFRSFDYFTEFVSHLSFASAITGVRGTWDFLLGTAYSWDSSLLISCFSSGYSSGKLSRMEGWQVCGAGSEARRSWLPFGK